MGRYAKPLLVAPPLPPLESCVEVFVCEARLQYQNPDNPDDVEENQLMTVLVALNPSHNQRLAARNLATTYLAAQSVFEQLPVGQNLADWLLRLLNSRIPASMNIVLSLPPVYSESDAHQIQSFLTGLRDSQHHQLGLAVGVGYSLNDWGNCHGVDGFVSTEDVDSGRESLHVFKMLAALMAPGLAYCVDSEDLRLVLGSHQKPSRFVTGVFLERENALVIGCSEHEKLLNSSQAIAYMPLHPIEISTQNKVLGALRRTTSSDSTLVTIAASGMSVDSSLPTSVIPVVMLAKPSDTRAIDA